MAGARQPINLLIAKGNKHLTKAEIEERQKSEPQPVTDGIVAPSFLTAKQKKEFDRIADQLETLGVMGETDCDTLARYIVAQDLYAQAVKDLRALQRQRPKGADLDAEALVVWADLMNKLDKRTDRYFKQATTAAAALGLTISSRCKLVVPSTGEPPKRNKFIDFKKAAGNG